MKNIFLNDRHEVRSGWKLAAFYAILILLWVATGITFLFFFANNMGIGLPENQLTLLTVEVLARFPAAILATLLMVKFVDYRPIQTFGLTLRNWQRDLMRGLVLTAIMLGILMVGSYAFGYVHIEWTAGQAPVNTLIMTLFLLMVAAAVEELMFRGFPLQVLSEGIGMWPATLVMSGLFALAHFDNPNASLLGLANTLLAGVLLSLAYLKTRSLWLPFVIHLGWNAGIGFVLGLPVSGVDIASLWTTGVAGSDFILGGAYGPEGGLLTTFIFGISTLIVHRKYTHPSTLASPNAAGHQPE